MDTLAASHSLRPVEIEVVRGALNRLSLLAQTLSGAQQGDPERYADTFAETLGEPLRSGAASVICVVENDGLHYAGSEVSGNDLVIKGIVRNLEAHSVAAITLLPGIPREELIELAHLLAQPRAASGGTEAASTLSAQFLDLGFQFVHFEISVTRLIREDDQKVRPMELMSRLTSLLGISEDMLEVDAYIELAGTMGGVRTLAGAPYRGRTASPTMEPAWGRQMRDVQARRDVPPAFLSMLTMESLQSSGAAELTERTAAVWTERVRESFASGDPDLAAQILRPLIISADSEYRPADFDGRPVRAALRPLFFAATRKAIARGIEVHPATDGWVRVLFTLGAGLTEDLLLEYAAIGRTMPSGAIREALGDALAFAIDRLDGVHVRDLLSNPSDDALPVLLQAARRFSDPTLIEPLLARLRHDDPVIREAALLALRAQQSPRIKAAAREAIADPHRSVRMEALRYVSVYRDEDSASIVADKLQATTARDTDLEELKALAIAWLHTSRGTAIGELEATAKGPNPKHPDLPAACISALSRAGAPGKEAMDRLGRAVEFLRPIIREYSTAKPQERRS